jgi:hypothetical protein
MYTVSPGDVRRRDGLGRVQAVPRGVVPRSEGEDKLQAVLLGAVCGPDRDVLVQQVPRGDARTGEEHV